MQLQQAQALFDCGRKSAAEVAEVSSQEANYDYLLTEQQNNLAMAHNGNGKVAFLVVLE
jgi:hypothetical protein